MFIDTSLEESSQLIRRLNDAHINYLCYPLSPFFKQPILTWKDLTFYGAADISCFIINYAKEDIIRE